MKAMLAAAVALVNWSLPAGAQEIICRGTVSVYPDAAGGVTNPPIPGRIDLDRRQLSFMGEHRISSVDDRTFTIRDSYTLEGAPMYVWGQMDRYTGALVLWWSRTPI